MSQLGVGKEVLSMCTKCKLKLNHMIIAMKDTTSIAKVQCLTCKSIHRFKDPSAATLKKVPPKTRRKAPKTVPIETLWQEYNQKRTGQAMPYSIRSRFSLGDTVDHKKFGLGFVHDIVDDKIEVVFQSETRMLVHGK